MLLSMHAHALSYARSPICMKFATNFMRTSCAVLRQADHHTHSTSPCYSLTLADRRTRFGGREEGVRITYYLVGAEKLCGI